MERYDIDKLTPIEQGGTGATTAEQARNNLGLGNVATENMLPISKGGTGGNTFVKSASISGKTITLNMSDGTTKTLTTQDTNTTYTAGTGLSLSSGKFSLASAYSNPITGASISGKVITLTFADGTTETLTTQDTAPFTARATAIGGASTTKPAVVVTTYQSGTSWYRKWSDGWVEQGGKITTTGTVTVTLPVKMSSAEYHVALGYNYGTTLDVRPVDTKNRTASGFQVPMGSSSNLYVYWTVSGKAA